MSRHALGRHEAGPVRSAIRFRARCLARRIGVLASHRPRHAGADADQPLEVSHVTPSSPLHPYVPVQGHPGVWPGGESPVMRDLCDLKTDRTPVDAQTFEGVSG